MALSNFLQSLPQLFNMYGQIRQMSLEEKANKRRTELMKMYSSMNRFQNPQQQMGGSMAIGPGMMNDAVPSPGVPGGVSPIETGMMGSMSPGPMGGMSPSPMGNPGAMMGGMPAQPTSNQFLSQLNSSGFFDQTQQMPDIQNLALGLSKTMPSDYEIQMNNAKWNQAYQSAISKQQEKSVKASRDKANNLPKMARYIADNIKAEINMGRKPNMSDADMKAYHMDVIPKAVMAEIGAAKQLAEDFGYEFDDKTRNELMQYISSDVINDLVGKNSSDYKSIIAELGRQNTNMLRAETEMRRVEDEKYRKSLSVNKLSDSIDLATGVFDNYDENYRSTSNGSDPNYPFYPGNISSLKGKVKGLYEKYMKDIPKNFSGYVKSFEKLKNMNKLDEESVSELQNNLEAIAGSIVPYIQRFSVESGNFAKVKNKIQKLPELLSDPNTSKKDIYEVANVLSNEISRLMPGMDTRYKPYVLFYTMRALSGSNNSNLDIQGLMGMFGGQ